jgi:hypothetical protein
VCVPGCGSRACPVGPARTVAGSDQVRSPGGAAAGASWPHRQRALVAESSALLCRIIMLGGAYPCAGS